MYQETGRGGECMDCEGYRDGPNCEVCKPNHYFSHTPGTDFSALVEFIFTFVNSNFHPRLT